jgi:hypothetical protein
MNNPLRTSKDYELFLYTLTDQFPSVRRSTVTLIRRGATIARVTGELYFDGDVRLVVRERLVYHRLPVVIDWYGYEVWRENKKLYWYDSQPHPRDPTLQGTEPHHKHMPPDIKHHRIPAPAMSFTQPNLPTLIHEIEALINKIKGQSVEA